MTLSAGGRIGLAGAAVVGVAFGMARYAYGVTLPDIRADLGLSELVLGLIASATFVGYLAGLLLAAHAEAFHPRLVRLVDSISYCEVASPHPPPKLGIDPKKWPVPAAQLAQLGIN